MTSLFLHMMYFDGIYSPITRLPPLWSFLLLGHDTFDNWIAFVTYDLSSFVSDLC